MKKLTLFVTLGMASLFWVSTVMADPHGNRGLNRPMIHKGKTEKQIGVKNVYHADELRDLGHQQIKEGKELINVGRKDEGKALIQQGVDNIHKANELHREGVHDIHQGNQDIFEGRKNIRDREHH